MLTPPATVGAPLPDGDYTYTLPGTTTGVTVTISRKGDAIVVAWSGKRSAFIPADASVQVQYPDPSVTVSSETTLGSALAISSYSYTWKQGLVRSAPYTFYFNGSQAKTNRLKQALEALEPSTSWIGLSPYDPGALVALPAQVRGCNCVMATAADIDNSRRAFYFISTNANGATPPGVPSGDLPLEIHCDAYQVIEWYDAKTMVPDYIHVNPGMTFVRQR